ncbi:MAG: hypothetical protein HFI90_11410 [Clostridia bacterium]|nr:hypothetical protein [Clostridia bacterium]
MEYKANVHVITKPGTLKGFASISLDDEFVVRGLSIREGKNGLFVSFPSEKVGREFRDTAYPITAEARTAITQVVLGEYEQKLEQAEEHRNEAEQEQKKEEENKPSSTKSQKSGSRTQKDRDKELLPDGEDETLEEEQGPVMGGM